MPGASLNEAELLAAELINGNLVPDEFMDLGNGDVGLSYDELEKIVPPGTSDQVIAALENDHGALNDFSKAMVVFPAAKVSQGISNSISNGMTTLLDLNLGGSNAGGLQQTINKIQGVFGPNSGVTIDAMGNVVIDPGQGGLIDVPSSSIIEDLLDCGEVEPDGGIYLNQVMIEKYLTEQGKDPKAARSIMQTVIKQGADDLDGPGNEAVISPELVGKLIPARAKPDPEKAYGRRLADGCAFITQSEYEEYLTDSGRDAEDAEIDMEDLVNMGAAWHGDQLLVPADIVEHYAIPVPPIPAPRRLPQQTPQQTAAAPITVAELFGLDEEVRTVRHKQIITHDYFDKEMFGDLVDQSPVIKQGVVAGKGVLKSWPELTLDLWHLLFKVEPKIRLENAIDPAFLANLYLIHYARKSVV